jgi:NAD(P)-dependent dehydrogenase (short-subunit alcohol dehydrogenase family)
MHSLNDKVALITGGGQGVGQGIALALGSAGARVALLGRTLHKLKETRQSIIARGGEAVAIVCDVKIEQSLAEAVRAVISQYGSIDILVNNAQEVPSGRLLDVTDDLFEAGWQSGPLAAFRLMKMCHPYLKGGGCIINLASSAGKHWDVSGQSCYAAVKEALRQLTRGAACEWGQDGIRTNAILPLAESPALQRWAAKRPEKAAEFFNQIPVHRLGDSENDIGRFVVALCSDDCRYVNGQSIGLDGGQAFLG